MPEFQYKRGKFVTFRATTKFHLGEKQRDIWEGDEIDFDGQTVKHQGEEFGAPSIRGAVKAGWLVPADGGDDNISRYIPQAADVVVHKAASTGRDRGEPIKIGRTQDEEQEVGLIEAHRKKVKEAREKDDAPRPRIAKTVEVEPPPEPEKLDPLALIDEMTDEELANLSEDELVALGMADDEPVEPEATTERKPRTVEDADRINMEILARAKAVEVPPAKDMGGTRHDSVDDGDTGSSGKKFAFKRAVDDQGGQVVSKIKTSATGVSVGAEGVRVPPQAVDVTKTTPSSVKASMRPIGGGKRPKLEVDASSGRADKLAAARRIIAARKAEKEAKIEAAPPKKAAKKTKKKAAKKAVKKVAKKGGASSGVVVIQDPMPEEADFEVKVPRGTATQITEGDPMDKSNGTTGDVRETRAADDLVDLLPDAVVAGGKPTPKIVGQDAADFSWDKSLHWATRVKLAVANYGNQPETIKQILAMETPSVAKQIQSKLAKQG